MAAELGVGGKTVRLASEDDLARDYPEFELGRCRRSAAVDEQLADRDSVVAEAGSHDRSVRLKAGNLVRLTGAQVADIRREEPAAL